MEFLVSWELVRGGSSEFSTSIFGELVFSFLLHILLFGGGAQWCPSSTTREQKRTPSERRTDLGRGEGGTSPAKNEFTENFPPHWDVVFPRTASDLLSTAARVHARRRRQRNAHRVHPLHRIFLKERVRAKEKLGGEENPKTRKRRNKKTHECIAYIPRQARARAFSFYVTNPLPLFWALIGPPIASHDWPAELYSTSGV